MKEHEILDKSVLDYKVVLELEYVLERLSDTLSRKVEQLAGGIYTLLAYRGNSYVLFLIPIKF